MAANKNITAKRITALLLIALLFFINAVKFLHTHNYSLPTQNQYVILVSSKGNTALPLHNQLVCQSCAICDFHLIKDTELPTDYILPSIFAVHLIHTISARQKSNTASILSCSNKGPPYLV